MIFDLETNDFVCTVSEGKRAWIGAHRVGPLIEPNPRNDQWTWIDGSAFELSNWDVNPVNQPDNHLGDEFCLEMINCQLNDLPCDYNLDYYICQVEPF